MAGRFRVSTLWDNRPALAGVAGAPRVPRVPARGFRAGRNDLPPNTQAASYVVPRSWQITSQKYGGNALGLQRDLGLKSYETAWAWLHKFRRAMVRPGRDQLDGIVEVDEAYVGGVEETGRGRYTETKAIVAVAVEIVDEVRLGRIRMQVVPDASAASLGPFLKSAITPTATVITDAWSGYT